MKKRLTIALTLASILAMSCAKDKKEIPNDSPAVAVKLSGVTGPNQSPFVMASGKIEAENSANISTRIMGYVTKVNVKVGQKVTLGQPLISINGKSP